MHTYVPRTYIHTYILMYIFREATIWIWLNIICFIFASLLLIKKKKKKKKNSKKHRKTTFDPLIKRQKQKKHKKIKRIESEVLMVKFWLSKTNNINMKRKKTKKKEKEHVKTIDNKLNKVLELCLKTKLSSSCCNRQENILQNGRQFVCSNL